MGSIILFDTEYTAWKGSQERNFSEPWEHKEIIQIAALKVDLSKRLEIMDTFDTHVQPALNPTLSDYITNLTGITQHDVAQAPHFEEALQKFHAFCEEGTLHCYCWGIDGEILALNCKLLQIPMPAFSNGFHDLKPYIHGAGIDTDSVYSGELSQHLGLESNPQLHHAQNDTKSLFVSLRHLIESGRIDPGDMLEA